MANRFHITIEASASYSAQAPTLEVLVGGIVVSMSLVTSQTGVGTDTFEFTLSYTGSFPSSLQFRFNDGLGEVGRSITLERVDISGYTIDMANLSSTVMAQFATSSLNMANTDHLFGRVEPTLPDFPTPTINGTGAADDIRGTNGNDIIDAGSGDDRIFGGTGDNVVFGGTGNDFLFGGSGNDVLVGGSNDDVISGAGGHDLLYGGTGNDTVIGGAGNDTLSGGAGLDALVGGTGNDILYGEGDADALVGDAGNDFLYGDAGADVIDGGSGDDTIYGGTEDDYIAGGADNDTIYGEAGADDISGGAGNDIIDGGTESDRVTGGLGDDTISGGAGTDFLYGDDGTDTINGDGDGDSLSGGAGADTLNGGDGNDALYGHSRNFLDISAIIQANPNVTYSLATNSFYQYVAGPVNLATAQANAAATLLSGVAGRLVSISSATENAFVHALKGATIAWTGGSDATNEGEWRWLGTGTDNGMQFWQGTNTGSAQNNYYTNWSGTQPDNTGNADGLIIQADGTWADQTVASTHGYIIEWDGHLFSDDNAADTLNGGNGNDILVGGGGNDILSGDANNDQIYGNAGDDTLNGGDNDDFIADYEGSNTFNGGNGNDILDARFAGSGAAPAIGAQTMNGGAGTDSIYGGAQGDTINGDADIDTIYAGAGNDTVNGGTEDDYLYGEDGDDTLNGDNGADTLAGGDGADTINGGDGNDFLYGHGITIDEINAILAANPGTVYNPDTGSFYQVITTTANWATAQANAIATTLNGVAGHLVAIETAAENAYVFSLTGAVTSWLGASDALVDDVWLWMTGPATGIQFWQGNGGGSAVNGLYNNWQGGDPNGAPGGPIDYAIMNATGAWFDRAGTETHRYVIEWESSSFPDDNAADILDGGAGDDYLYGNGGDDILSGGADNDRIFDGAGNDTGNGGTGNDYLFFSAGNDIINGDDGNDIIIGGTGVDTINGGANDDTMYLANGDFAAGESITGGTGTDVVILTNATTVDFTTGTLATLETLTGSTGNDTVTMLATHIAGMFTTVNLQGGTDILNVRSSGVEDVSAATLATVTNVETGNLIGSTGNDTLTITGAQLNSILIGTGTVNFDTGTDTLNITSTSTDLNTLGATNASIQGLEAISAATAGAGVTITLSGQTEAFTVTGSGFADTITAGTGADTITGGAGNDTINLANGAFAAGESLTGGADTDAIILTNATTVDFTTGTLATLETLTGSTGNDTVTMLASHIAGMFTTVNLQGGTDILNVRSSGVEDVSVATLATVTNVETGNLIGSTGDDDLTITGAQLDAIIVGTGTINFNTGTDVLNITSTSADLNTLGVTNASIQGLEAISAATAAAGVTITLSGQTEAFTVTGSGNGDIITGGTGADIIDAGGGNDTINLANGAFAAGESLTGNAGTDAIVFTNATTVDFTTGTLATIETLTGFAGNDTVTVSATQWAMFSTINLVSGTDVLNVLASGDISASATPTVSNVDTGNLTGTGGNDSTTMTGAQLNAILIGGGTINLGAGTADALNITSTSTDLNALNDASITNTEIISAATAGAGVTLSLGNQTESLTITGSDFNDTITGSTAADTIDAGAGDDTINIPNGSFDAGESITGGAGTDTIVLTSGGGGNVDFSVGTLITVENITTGGGGDTITLTAAQWADLSSIDMAGGSDTINIVASGDISADATLPTMTSIADGFLTGTGGNDTTTMTGAQLNAIIFGSGTINTGGGTDTLNLTSTSTDLNTLGATNASIQALEVISASTAAAGVTITLSGQTEGFTVTGSANNDTLTLGSGADTLYGGAGDDTLTGGSGQDTFVFDVLSGTDTIADFSTAQSDNLDISDLLTGFVAGVSDIDDFCRFVVGGGNTTVQVDTNGTTGGASWTTIATLSGVTGLVVQTLYNNGDIIA